MLIYYEDQKDWTKSEYCYLHRYLHSLLFYYKEHQSEISEMNTDRMSDATKVLIYCIIKYYHYDFMFDDYQNLSSLKNTSPLAQKLILDDSTLQEDDIYKKMNVVY